MPQPRMSRRTFLMALIGGGGAAAVAGATVGRRYIQRVLASVTTPPLQVKTLNDLDKNRTFDVLIIGSGPAGALLGRDLADKGIDTLILEAGPNLSSPDPRINVAALESYRNIGGIQYPVPTSHIRAVGGTSAIWSGRTPRMHPLDFEPSAYSPEGAGWPITYEELDPYYERAEQSMRVSGGKLSEFFPPHNRDLPFGPRDDISALKSLMSTVDVTVDDCPTSLGLMNNGQPLRVSTDILPFFTASSHGTLVSGAAVTRLIADSSGNIEGIEVRDFRDGNRVLTANTYVIACGGMESARLLLVSRSDGYPQGIGNNSDMVGRFFNEHPDIMLQGHLPAGKQLSSVQIGRSYQFYESFKQQNLGGILFLLGTSADGSVIKLGVSAEMLPMADNRITLAPDLHDGFGKPGIDVSFDYTPKDLETFEAADDLIRSIMGDLGVTEIEQEPSSWSYHHIGTCRMGNDPATSVVDSNLLVHGTSNLHVLSSAVFVTGGAANPTLTIAALAHRLAHHLAAV